jgi:predicted transcriptional regulator
MKDRVITAHVPLDLAREVDQLAEQIDRTRGWIVKEALGRYVELERKRRLLTEEALADVDAGRTVEHASVERWAAGLKTARRRSRR